MNTKKLIKYLKNSEFDIQSARACLFMADLYYSSYADSKALGDVAINPIFCYLKTLDGETPFYQVIEKKILDKYMEKLYSEYLKNPRGFRKKMKRKTILAKKMDKIFKNYQKNKNNLSDSDLLGFFDKMIKISKEWCEYSGFGEDKGQMINIKIENFFVDKYKIKSNEAGEIIGIITHPEEMAVFSKERKSFLNIERYILKNNLKNNAGKLSKDKKLGEIVKRYINAYFWVKTDFYSKKEITCESLLSEIMGEMKNKTEADICKELKDIDNNLLRIKKEKRKLLIRLKLSREEIRCLKFAELLVAWQDSRKLEMMKQFFYLFTLIENISEKIGISHDQAAARTISELRKILSGERIVLKKPTQFLMFFRRNKNIRFFSGNIAEKMFKLALKYGDKEKTELKGFIASRGGGEKISGIVKIIGNPSKQKFKAGEILITSMTRVEFVPLMRKAKAIITNEGGIACHAAIVSRELGIPCIIGTKIATKILKNGDNVKMDMKTGIVKIIK
ncbi:MAG: PEP-utilizing enzyme [Patescibacteria group bacterium]